MAGKATLGSAALLGAVVLSWTAVAQTYGSDTSGHTGARMNDGFGSPGTPGITSENTNGSADWDEQNTYWRSHYPSRPYYNKSRDYSTMEPAYRYGVDLYNQNPGKRYEDLDPSHISSGWNQARGDSTLNWNEAQAATRDAYTRMYDSRINRGTDHNSNSSGSLYR